MRAPSIPIGLFLVALAGQAAAVASCGDACHLYQGQPLLLGDRKQLWEPLPSSCKSAKGLAKPARGSLRA